MKGKRDEERGEEGRGEGKGKIGKREIGWEREDVWDKGRGEDGGKRGKEGRLKRARRRPSLLEDYCTEVFGVSLELSG